MRKTLPSIILVLLMFVPVADAGFPEELRMENSHFVIRYTAGDERLPGKLKRESLRIRERVIADIGMDFTEKTEIRLCPTLETFREAQPGGTSVPLWSIGVAYSAENVIVLLSPRAIKFTDRHKSKSPSFSSVKKQKAPSHHKRQGLEVIFTSLLGKHNYSALLANQYAES